MKKEAPKQAVKAKTRRPAIGGRNTPKNVNKAFRTHGKGAIVRAAINGGRGYVAE